MAYPLIASQEHLEGIVQRGTLMIRESRMNGVDDAIKLGWLK